MARFTRHMLIAVARNAGLRLAQVSERFDYPLVITRMGHASVTIWETGAITRDDKRPRPPARGMTPRRAAMLLQLPVEVV